MKFIVNSQTFFNALQHAFRFNCTEIKVQDDAIIFVCLRDIPMMVHFLVHHDSFRIKFVGFRWNRVRNLLQELPEQPITVDLSEDRIEISCVNSFLI